MHEATLHKDFISKAMLLCHFRVADGSTLVSGQVKKSSPYPVFQQAVFLSSRMGQMGLIFITSPLLLLKMVTQKFFNITQSIIHAGSELAYL